LIERHGGAISRISRLLDALAGAALTAIAVFELTQ